MLAPKPTVSRHPWEKLRVNLRRHLWWSGLITALYGVVVVAWRLPAVQYPFAVAILFNVVVLIQGLRLYRLLHPLRLSDAALLPLLQQVYARCRGWERMQYRLAMLVYPVAIAGGYWLGGVVATGLPLGYLMQQPLFRWGLPVSVLLLSVTGFFLARYLFRRQFGVYLENMEEHIRALEEQ